MRKGDSQKFRFRFINGLLSWIRIIFLTYSRSDVIFDENESDRNNKEIEVEDINDCNKCENCHHCQGTELINEVKDFTNSNFVNIKEAIFYKQGTNLNILSRVTNDNHNIERRC